jgi:maltose alpha-D-glucosyltransferase/alpha-amylase
MPRIFMAIGRGEAEPIRWALEQTPAIPDNCQWCIFLRNHDELTLEMVTEAERQWMWDAYAPDPRTRINLGIRRRLAPLLGNDRRRIELANSLLFTLPGSPIIYYGDEIGMGDNISIPDRGGVRTPMQWDASRGAGFSAAAKLYLPLVDSPPFQPAVVNVESQRAAPGSLWHIMQAMIAARKQHAALADGNFEWRDCGSPAVAGYTRANGSDQLLILNNLSSATQTTSVRIDRGKFRNILNQGTFAARDGILRLELQPYQYLWLQA